MPPKAAKSTAPDSPETLKTNKVMDDELKLTWALICQMSTGGKLVGVNWDEVQSQIEAPTKHAAYLRWDSLKKRMKTRGFEFPKDRTPAEAKAKVGKAKVTHPKVNGIRKPRGKKAKEATEAEVKEETQVSSGEGSGSGDEATEEEE